MIKYKLAPQTKFYDSMGANWKSFVMFNHFPNLRSKYCNTDINGLRFNNFKNEEVKMLAKMKLYEDLSEDDFCKVLSKKEFNRLFI